MIYKATSRIKLTSIFCILFAGYMALSLGAVYAVTPTIGDELAVSSMPISAVGQQRQVAVAAGLGNYLVVWTDGRDLSGSSYDIYGIFVDENGTPIDDESFLITKDVKGNPLPDTQSSPSVAFNGTNFLVVWATVEGGESFSRICGTRVSTTGNVLDPGGIQISTIEAENQAAPRVASNGVDWEVVWQKGGTYIIPDIIGARVTATGTVTARILIASTADTEVSPQIAWNGLTGADSAYLVVWEVSNAESDIYGYRINSSGAKIGTSATLISNSPGLSTTRMTGNQFIPSVSSGKDSSGNPGGWLVVWEDSRENDTYTDVYGTRVSSTGIVDDLGGFRILQDVSKNSTRPIPQVGWNGSDYVVVFRDPLNLNRVKRIFVGWDAYVQPGPGSVSQSSAGGGGVVISSTSINGKSLIAWELSGYTDIVGCSLSSSGTASNEIVFSRGVQPQLQPSAVFNGTHTVVVWADKRNGTYQIYGARCLPDGTVLDVEGKVIGISPYQQTQPSIAWNPQNGSYLVVWKQETQYTNSADIIGVRINSDLNRIGSTITICADDLEQRDPVVSCNGSQFMVAWTDARYGDDVTNVQGTRVDASGNVLARLLLCLNENQQENPAIGAVPGGGWLVAWEDTRTGTSNLYTRTVSSSGSMGVESLLSSRTSYKYTPSIAYDGTNYFVTWYDSYSSQAICGAFVNGSGQRIAGSDIFIRTGSYNLANPKVVWTGEKYAVTWEDDRNQSNTNTDIYLSRIHTDGTVEDSGGILVTNLAPKETQPVFAPISATQVNAFYISALNSINRLRERVCYFATPPPPQRRIDEMKQLPDGTRAEISNVIVTAGNNQLPGMFYIEDRARLVGLRVAWSDTVIREGMIVTVVGSITTENGERKVTAETVTVLSEDNPVPGALGIRNGDMGGAAAGLCPGVVNGIGPNNVGLLVKCWGRVISPGDGYFYLQDHSRNLAGPALLKVKCNHALPPADFFYSVTGISSCETGPGGSIPLLLVRKPEDVFKSQQPVPATMKSLKTLPDYYEVSIDNQLVTAGNDQLPSILYVEDRQNLAGIRINWSGTTVSEASNVSFSGLLKTANGERQITAKDMTVNSTGNVLPAPLGIRAAYMGGSTAGKNPGIANVAGPYNIGLLVKVWGRVRNPGNGYFYIEDGSKQLTGVPKLQKIKCQFTLPLEGEMYVVTGISSCELQDIDTESVLLIRKPTDMLKIF